MTPEREEELKQGMEYSLEEQVEGLGWEYFDGDFNDEYDPTEEEFRYMRNNYTVTVTLTKKTQ